MQGAFALVQEILQGVPRDAQWDAAPLPDCCDDDEAAVARPPSPPQPCCVPADVRLDELPYDRGVSWASTMARFDDSLRAFLRTALNVPAADLSTAIAQLHAYG